MVWVSAGGHCVVPSGTLGHEVAGGSGGHSGVNVIVLGGEFGGADGQLEGPGHSPVRL